MSIDKKEFINQLKEMKVSELSELIKAIEEEFGVKAAAPVTANAAVVEEESSEKTVELISAGGNKIAVIKLVKELLGLGLMESKQFAEKGGILKEKVSPEEAEEVAKKFTDAGAEVKIK
ncbi:MAG: 50S ribosomal protein L7/L12 [Candidatus Hepatoplasma vulgare]|nr:MAG: 50S ribosomal protein L7/L12 [Candidatus Hepatoplasma sp.]